MPEYLAPGVFVEEVSFRSKSIQGVATSTTGFAGLTHFGPVRYDGGPRACEPRLVTSYAEFERVYGGLTPLQIGGRLPYLAHAARAFFLNGGRRLYVSRVYRFTNNQVVLNQVRIPVGAREARFVARWPGAAGNVTITMTATRGGDIGTHQGGANPASSGAGHGTIIEVVPGNPPPAAPPAFPKVDAPLVVANLRVLRIGAQGAQTFVDSAGNAAATPGQFDLLLPITVNVTVSGPDGRADAYSRLGLIRESRGAASRVLAWDDPADENTAIAFEFPAGPAGTAPAAVPASQPMSDQELGASLTLLGDLEVKPNVPPTRTWQLTGGTDGVLPTPDQLNGEEADPDNLDRKATGLYALAEVDDIAIVAMPDSGDLGDDDTQFLAAQHLVRHAERCKYRIAVVDGPRGASINKIRSFRGSFDSTYAAIYHPWIEILDPNGPPAPGVPTPRLQLPPSGFVTGIYARSDIARGVFKAPANEVVYGLTRFEMNINQGRNEVLNPEGINALRFFPGRGNRVWGARTMTSDPEWMYVNVRRFFIFLEHSIDKATQWAVFEPNGEALWRNITRTVSDFLEVQWRNGALLGKSPEDAFFVLCDRSTMTQNDLDNGRLICLVGVAAIKPAEFVIFRIGQWTASAKG